MKTTIKRILSLSLAVALLLALTACGSGVQDLAAALKGNLSTSQALTLAQGDCDALFHGTTTDDYLTMIGDTKESVDTAYQNTLSAEAEYYAGLYGIEYLTDDIQARLVKAFDLIYTKTSYTLGEPTVAKNDDIIIPVTIAPVDAASLVDAELESAAVEFNEKYADADFEAMTEEEYQAYDAEWADMVISILEKNISSMGYLDEREAELVVAKDTDGLWCTTDASIQEVYEMLISYD